MTTLWKYTPVLGDFSSPLFSVTNNADLAIPRDDASDVQGTPRPGVLKWFLSLVTSDPTDGSDDESIKITVPTPFAFTADDITTKGNSLLPLVTIVPENAAVYTQKVFVESFLPVVDEDGCRVVITVTVGAAAAAALNPAVIIDFSHSSIN